MNDQVCQLNASLLLSASMLLLAGGALARAVEGQDLRCEYRTDPLGIDAPAPRLSWVITSGRRGVHQTARRIIVASTAKLLARNRGDLWDSSIVRSDQSVQVEYAGVPLKSRMQCFWKVQVWTGTRTFAWGDPALWTMGLLDPEDWQAKWIGVVEERQDEAPAIDMEDGAAALEVGSGQYHFSSL